MMTAGAEIAALYEQWRSLTASELEAIQQSRWGDLQQAQAAKLKLRGPLGSALDRFLQGSDSHPGAKRSAEEIQLRKTRDELVALEQQNAQLLDRRLAEARRELKALDQSSRNLRQLSRSYSRSSETAHWQSFS